MPAAPTPAVERALLLGATLVLMTSIWLSGGAFSPLLPFVVVPPMVAGLRRREVRRVTMGSTVFLLVVFGLALVDTQPARVPTLDAAVLTALTGILGASAVRRVRERLDQRRVDVRRQHERAAATVAARHEELVGIAGALAHQLKNPLTAVNGLASLLARRAAETPALGELAQETRKLNETVSTLLDFSRPTSPSSLCRAELGALLRELAGPAGVTVTIDGEAEVLAEPRKLTRVLGALVEAAARAQAPVTATLQGGADRAVLRWSARGPVRLGTQARRLAERLAEQHGGRLQVRESDEGLEATLSWRGVEGGFSAEPPRDADSPRQATRTRLGRRTRLFVLMGAGSQPVGALALAVCAILVGGPWWAPWLYLPFALGSGAYVGRHAIRGGAPSPGGMFVLMSSGVFLAMIAGGFLESPVCFALGTLPVGAATLGPTLRFARRIQVWMLGTLLVAACATWVGSPLAEAAPYVDRAVAGPGRVLGHVLVWMVLASGVSLGGLAARQLRRAIDENEALEEAAHAERVASVEARSADVRALATALADELRAPLDDVRRRVADLLTAGVDAAASRHLEVLRAEVERVVARLEHHATFARPATDLAPVAVDELLTELAAQQAGLAAERGVTVAVEGGPGASAVISTDAEKLIEIVENLVQNAIEATPEGGAVKLSARTDDARVAILVHDDGPGLPPEAARLFTPGFTTKAQGSGLGLVLSRALAAQLHGELTLASAGSRGALATLTLPRSAPP